MRTIPALPLLLALLGLLAGCGSGGSASEVPVETELFALSDNRLTLQPRTITYRVSGEVSIDGQAPVAITGTATTLQGQPEAVGGGLCASLETREYLDGDVPLLTRVFSRREESSNHSLRTGQRLQDGTALTWQSAFPQGPLVYDPGEEYVLERSNSGFVQGSAIPRLLLDQFTWSVDRVGIIEVPAGRFECYVIYSTERLYDALTDTADVTSRIVYMRPDLGVIQSTVHINRRVGDTSKVYSLTYEAESVH